MGRRGLLANLTIFKNRTFPVPQLHNHKGEAVIVAWCSMFIAAEYIFTSVVQGYISKNKNHSKHLICTLYCVSFLCALTNTLQTNKKWMFQCFHAYMFNAKGEMAILRILIILSSPQKICCAFASKQTSKLFLHKQKQCS